MSDTNVAEGHIVVQNFLQKKGNRVGKAAIKFGNFGGAGACTFVGFTICDDKEKGMFVLFPSSIVKRNESQKPYFFLRPDDDDFLENLQNKILDLYEMMVPRDFSNTPKIQRASVTAEHIDTEV